MDSWSAPRDVFSRLISTISFFFSFIAQLPSASLTWVCATGLSLFTFFKGMFAHFVWIHIWMFELFNLSQHPSLWASMANKEGGVVLSNCVLCFSGVAVWPEKITLSSAEEASESSPRRTRCGGCDLLLPAEEWTGLEQGDGTTSPRWKSLSRLDNDTGGTERSRNVTTLGHRLQTSADSSRFALAVAPRRTRKPRGSGPPVRMTPAAAAGHIAILS